jgi:hypothetical protein
MRSPLAWLLAIGMVGASMAGCNGSGGTPLAPSGPGNGGNGQPPNQLGTAFIRIIMASPDYVAPSGGGVDVYIDGTRVWQNVTYANFNGKAGGVGTAPFYVTSVFAVPLSPSAHNVQIYPAGAAAGNATQLATVTTGPGAVRTTVVIADKVFGALPLALQGIAFTEPTLVAPPGQSSNVVIHHAAPSGGSGTLTFGSITGYSASNPGSISCLGTVVFSNPPLPQSTKQLSFVNSGGATIGYYVANAQLNFCKAPPSAEFFPGTAATPPPPSLPNPPGSFNAGVVYPTPAPNVAGQPTPAPFNCNNTLPPTCGPTTPEALAALPNLTLYAIDAPPVPPATTPGIAIIGVYDSNTQ